jgi:hypothetical protein
MITESEMEEDFVVDYKDERTWQREQVDALRRSALLGYGALLAHNTDGRYDLVLAAMREPLFPGDKQPG